MNELLLSGRVAPKSFWGGKTVHAQMVRDWLNKVTGDIVVKIDTYGGDVYEGINIYNLLRGYANSKGKVETVAMAKCMSIGTLILFGGDTRKAHKNSSIMAHKAWSGYYGNSDEMKQQGEILDGIDDILVEEYKKAMPKLSDEEIKQKMKDEMWFIGKKQLLESGFVTEIVETETLDPVDNPKSSYSSFFAEYMKEASTHNELPDFEQLKGTIEACHGSCKSGTPRESERPKDAVNSKEGDFSMTKEEIEKLQADFAKSQSTIEALNADLGNKDKEIMALKEANSALEQQHKDTQEASANVTKQAIHAGVKYGLSAEQMVEMTQEKNVDKMNTKLLDFVQSDGAVFGGGGNPQGNGGTDPEPNNKKLTQEDEASLAAELGVKI